MATYNLLLLAGDGIGPEVMAEVKRLLGFYAKNGIADFQTEEGSGRRRLLRRAQGRRSPTRPWRRRMPPTR